MRYIVLILFFCYGCESLIYSDYKIIKRKQNTTLSSYNVRSGDNLYSISKSLNVSISTLIQLNKIKAPYKIFPKQKIIYPKESLHKVKKGETLYSISRLYKTDVYTISKLNKIKNIDSISEGQSLKIYSKIWSNNSKLIKEKKRKEKKKIKKKKLIVKNNEGKFIWPVKGKLISKYGKSKKGFFNDGINIDSKINQKVLASNSGVVIYSGNEIPGYGNLVLIKHSENWVTAYAHLNEVFIERGEKVNKGESIGLVGKTGSVRKPQLHFEIRKGKDAVDPLKYLS